MSREAAVDVTVGECIECTHLYPRQLPVHDGRLLPHGRPVAQEQRNSREGSPVEPCPGGGTPPL